jgi:hypothetical protein
VSPFEIDFFSEASLDNKRLHRPFFIYTPFGYTSLGLAKTLQLYASQRVQVGPFQTEVQNQSFSGYSQCKPAG